MPEYRIDFGKYAGKRISMIPADYLVWLYEKIVKLKKIIEMEFVERKEDLRN